MDIKDSKSYFSVACNNLDLVGSLITKDIGYVFLPALVGDRLLLSFVISDPTLIHLEEYAQKKSSNESSRD